MTKSWLAKLFLAALVGAVPLFLRGVALTFGLSVWSIRPTPAQLVFSLLTFVLGVVAVYGYQYRRALLFASGFMLLLSVPVAIFSEEIFSPIEKMEGQQSLKFSSENGFQVLKHPTLGFSVLLPGAGYVQLFSGESSDVYRYKFVAQDEAGRTQDDILHVYFFSAALHQDELERYVDRLLEESTITARETHWEGPQREVLRVGTRNDQHLKLRALQVTLGAESKGYVVVLLGSSTTEEAAAQLVERFFIAQ